MRKENPMDVKACKECAHSLGYLGCAYEENNDEDGWYKPGTCPDFEQISEEDRVEVDG